jgi:hypothetical protein
VNGPQILLTQQSAAASFDFSATFAQAPASWDATDAETFSSTASFTQVAATWAAVASEAFSATGSFSQAAAAWASIVSETFASSGAWTQAAVSWAAEVAQSSDRTSVATFDQQAASWDASLEVPLALGGTGGKFGPVRLAPRQARPLVIPAISMDGTFVQPSAGWAAQAQRIQPPASFTGSFAQPVGQWTAATTVNDDDLALVLAA